jgi:hypothetical protein
MSTSEDEFDNEWLCPYCTALTQPADKSCPKCRRSLIVSKRVNPERSPWLWRGFFLQQMVAIGLLAVGATYYTLALKRHDIPDPVPFLPLYVGLPVDQPPALIQGALTAFPPVIFWSFIGAIIYSMVLMAVLYLRLPYGNVLYLINAGLLLLLGVIGLLLYFNSGIILTIALASILVGLGQLLITFNLWNDFTF